MRKEVNRLDVFVFVVRLATAVVGLLREVVAFSEKKHLMRTEKMMCRLIPRRRFHPFASQCNIC